MRWLLIFLFLFTCAWTPVTDNNKPRPEARGWYVMSDDGYTWGYQGNGGRLIGRCYYTYVRYNGNEQWGGVFYGKQTDFSFKPFYKKKLNSLYECVEWVEAMSLGGYYL